MQDRRFDTGQNFSLGSVMKLNQLHTILKVEY